MIINIDTKKATYTELVEAIDNLNLALSTKKPDSIKCCGCGKEFKLKGKPYSESLYRHLKRVHKYPEEDASISSGT